MLNAQEKWQVSTDSYIVIHGASNVEGFKCLLQSLERCDTLLVSGKPNGYDLNGRVHVDVARFKCDNRLMTKEFRSTLQYEEYPFISMDFAPGFIACEKPTTFIIDVTLHMVGNHQTYAVEMKASKDEQGRLHLSSTQPIKFSHFELKPPSKLAGLVKVRDDLDVEVNLILDKMD